MGMTDEQYIEVAEEVWGWKINGNGIILKPCGAISEVAITVEELRNEVLSWEGFGRTVEAMAEKGWDLIEYCDGADYNPALGFYNKNCPIGNHQRISWHSDRNLFTNSLITATHLAALEALKTRKE